MFVIIRSAPGTHEASRGVKLARDRAADRRLIRDGAFHVRKNALKGFCGTAFALAEDVRQTGTEEEEMERGIRTVSAEEMIEFLAGAEEVAGPFWDGKTYALRQKKGDPEGSPHQS
jgi:hypothetical protein